MIKNILVNATLCFVTAVLISSNHVSAAEIQADTAVAGINVSLDRFYAATLEQHMEDISNQVILEALAQEANTTSINDDNQNSNAINTEAVIEESPYAGLGISVAKDYVNIRNKPNENSKAVGKLYRGSAATILTTKGDWSKIKSGSVEGYIMSSYLAIGDEAEKVADKFGKKQATVTTTTLKVRDKMSLNSTVLTLIPEGETYDVIKEFDKWVKVQIDEDIVGFVMKASDDEKLVDIAINFSKAISIEEEQAKLEEEKAKREEQEAAIKEKVEEQSSSTSSSSNSSSNNNSSSSQSSSDDSQTSNDEPSSNSSSIVSYAMQFLGNPYVFGGTSLTNGTDCSGFTMQIYSHFGYGIPRTSRDQANAGSSVSLGSVRPGDLIFYTGSGSTINHVAMYIGGGQVIHASNPSTGIRISNMYYRTPDRARRIMN